MSTIQYDKILKKYPPLSDERSLDQILADERAKSKMKFIVLDDDPTGVQTVHDVNVYTDWSFESLCKGLNEKSNVFYVLTNSRGMTAEETEKIHKEIVSSAIAASKETGYNFTFISRSDSTLRGHYPLETEILKKGLEEQLGIHVDGEVLCPFFKEGGRYTIDDIHYVKQGPMLIPAADTEFAKDKTFGYLHSSIPEYVEEKTKGKYKAKDVTCISLESLRKRQFDGIKEQLLQVTDFNKICVNAFDYCDVKVFCIALYRAMQAGRHYMFRTAAGFVAAIAGISQMPLLERKQLVNPDLRNGGLIVVGSHTKKSTDQLNLLLTAKNVVPIKFESSLVLEGKIAFMKEIERCVKLEEKTIRSGKTAVCFTERTLLSLPDDSKESALIRSVKISDGVQSLVQLLTVTPSFIIAKGGITSSDIGIKALHVKRAKVLGQICPGIPVWQLGQESKFPSIPYVIFPGNVGEAATLKECYEKLIYTS